MFDTVIAVVGNALTMPEWRRLERTNALVANFKIASTSRRYDRNSNRWIDGDNLRLRVTCWRRLAEGVVASIKVGDPVVVTGRLYTREWTTEDGQRRTAYELEAVSVGHDLARGIGVFKRGRANLSTSVVEDAETDSRVGGEPSEVANDLNEESGAFAATLNEDDLYGEYDVPGATDVDDPFADLGTALAGDVAPPAVEEAAQTTVADAGPTEAGRGRRGRGRVPAPA